MLRVFNAFKWGKKFLLLQSKSYADSVLPGITILQPRERKLHPESDRCEQGSPVSRQTRGGGWRLPNPREGGKKKKKAAG